jgi:hypothetical protein
MSVLIINHASASMIVFAPLLCALACCYFPAVWTPSARSLPRPRPRHFQFSFDCGLISDKAALARKAKFECSKQLSSSSQCLIINHARASMIVSAGTRADPLRASFLARQQASAESAVPANIRPQGSLEAFPSPIFERLLI